MNIGFEYIKYRWKAKNRHGIHSPFVYTFTDKCLIIKPDANSLSLIDKIVKRLKADSRFIEVSDFGAGSKKMGKQRKVSNILATSSSKGKYGKLLYQLSNYYKPNQILELGTSLGIGTLHLQLGHPTSKVTTVEACPNTRAEAKKSFDEVNLDKINSIHATFDTFFSAAVDTTYDLVFVDGHHDGDALLTYMNHLKSITHNETIFVLDDIRWSDSMLNAWNKIVGDDHYHVTMDLFRMGIVVPRHQQEKEHFTIRL